MLKMSATASASSAWSQDARFSSVIFCGSLWRLVVLFSVGTDNERAPGVISGFALYWRAGPWRASAGLWFNHVPATVAAHEALWSGAVHRSGVPIRLCRHHTVQICSDSLYLQNIAFSYRVSTQNGTHSVISLYIYNITLLQKIQ